jgi:hypothetical protein
MVSFLLSGRQRENLGHKKSAPSWSYVHTRDTDGMLNMNKNYYLITANYSF